MGSFANLSMTPKSQQVTPKSIDIFRSERLATSFWTCARQLNTDAWWEPVILNLWKFIELQVKCLCVFVVKKRSNPPIQWFLSRFSFNGHVFWPFDPHYFLHPWFRILGARISRLIWHGGSHETALEGEWNGSIIPINKLASWQKIRMSVWERQKGSRFWCASILVRHFFFRWLSGPWVATGGDVWGRVAFWSMNFR